MRRRSWALALALWGCGDGKNGGSPDDGGPSAPSMPADAGTAGGIIDGGVPTQLSPALRAVAEAFDAERKKLGAPGAALLILQGGQIALAEGFGEKAPNAAGPVRPTTLFRIGSVTKALTSIALLRTLEDTEHNLDSTLAAVLPDFELRRWPSHTASTTVRDLLRHTSGLADYLDMEDRPEYLRDDGLSNFLTGPYEDIAYPMNPPGLFYNYSNPNYYLAGLIAERLAKMPYRHVMAARVFRPLGMDRTFFLADAVLADGDFAEGQSVDADGLPWTIRPDSYENAWARPAGFAYASVLDLAALLRFIRGDGPEVLAESSRREMLRPQINQQTFGELEQYSLGLAVLDGLVEPGAGIRPMRIYTHGGAIAGFAAELWYFQALDFGWITLASTDGAYFRDSLQLALQTLVTAPDIVARPDLLPNPRRFPRFVGRYFDPYNVGQVVVSGGETGLSVRMPTLDELQIPYGAALVPTTPNNFLLEIQGQPIGVTFIDDADGRPAYLRARAFVAARQSTLKKGRPRPRCSGPPAIRSNPDRLNPAHNLPHLSADKLSMRLRSAPTRPRFAEPSEAPAAAAAPQPRIYSSAQVRRFQAEFGRWVQQEPRVQLALDEKTEATRYRLEQAAVLALSTASLVGTALALGPASAALTGAVLGAVRFIRSEGRAMEEIRGQIAVTQEAAAGENSYELDRRRAQKVLSALTDVLMADA